MLRSTLNLKNTEKLFIGAKRALVVFTPGLYILHLSCNASFPGKGAV